MTSRNVLCVSATCSIICTAVGALSAWVVGTCKVRIIFCNKDLLLVGTVAKNCSPVLNSPLLFSCLLRQKLDGFNGLSKNTLGYQTQKQLETRFYLEF